GAGEVLAGGARGAVLLAAAIPFVAVVLSGYVACLRNRVTARECYVPLYLAAILAWPMGGSTPRFLLPLLPFVALYLAVGVFRLSSLVGPAWGRRAAFATGAAALLAFGALYARHLGIELPGVCQPEARQLFGFVRDETPRDAVIVFSKPRAL